MAPGRWANSVLVGNGKIVDIGEFNLISKVSVLIVLFLQQNLPEIYCV